MYRKLLIFLVLSFFVLSLSGCEKTDNEEEAINLPEVSLTSIDDFLDNFQVEFKQVYTPPSGANAVGTVNVIMTITKTSDFVLNGSYELNLVYFAAYDGYTRASYEAFQSDAKYIISFNVFDFDETLEYSFKSNAWLYTGTEEDGFTNIPIFFDLIAQLS